jgi:divalent metal cation (Fe/Co/Zn/Cd) transporter
MPLLARAKLRAGQAIGSRALVADAKETFARAWLSSAVVAGVGLNATFGWWWADSVAALLMVPLLIREGREAIEHARGKDDD